MTNRSQSWYKMRLFGSVAAGVIIGIILGPPLTKEFRRWQGFEVDEQCLRLPIGGKALPPAMVDNCQRIFTRHSTFRDLDAPDTAWTPDIPRAVHRHELQSLHQAIIATTADSALSMPRFDEWWSRLPIRSAKSAQ